MVGVAELRPVRLRRRRVRVRPRRSGRFRRHRGVVRAVLRRSRHPVAADRVQRAIGLPGVHQQRHSRRAACSPAPKGSRPPSRRRSGAGPPGSPTTPATTRPVTTIANLSLEALDINADAIAYAVLNYAMNTEPINGVPGKGNFRAPAVEDSLRRRSTAQSRSPAVPVWCRLASTDRDRLRPVARARRPPSGHRRRARGARPCRGPVPHRHLGEHARDGAGELSGDALFETLMPTP